MAQGKDFYAVLGVSESASADEIKKQYRRLAKKHHPDANKSDPKAAERFKEISEAYNVLGDAEQRKKYDEMRKYGAFGGFTSRPPGGGARPRPGAGAPPPGADAGGIDFEGFDIGGLGGLGDLFSSMFGGGARGGGSRARGPERGQDIEANVEIPFRTAATGGQVPITLEMNEECGTCHGSGGAPGAKLSTCPECKGRGTVSFGQGGFAVNRPCPMCLGRGQVPSERCPTCGGSGEVRARRTIKVNVPPGSGAETRLRLKGQGGRGASGGPQGDLIITFTVQPDRFYKREGLDLIATVPLNIAQATLGTKVSVRTLDGKKVTLKIPPGTPAGKRFRVREQGIEHNGARGDLLVEVTIVVPDKLTPDQEKLMREFAEAGGMKY
ncbi:MAG TPA: molecular chaperone DnaJ [Gemmatimonadaceae bacterium]|nr:molecular chaperone DnaJ [Gemmatimonadaceae bacterium]